MNVSLVSTDRDEDGVSKYSRDLLEELAEQVEAEWIKIDNPESSSITYWEKLAERANSGDITHIQHEYGLFGNFKDRLHGIMILPFLRNLETPLLTTLHSVNPRDRPDSLRPKKIVKFAMMKYADRMLFSSSDRLIVHSESSKNILSERVSPDKIEVISHGVRIKQREDKHEAKEKLGLKEEKVITLFGYIRRSKGYTKVLRAVQDLEYTVLIAGSAVNEEQERYREELEELAEELDMRERVNFTGYVEDGQIKTVMSATDILALPYDEITGSGVFTLGITYGVPMVASDLGYFKEKERKGLVDTFQDVSSLKSKIRKGPDLDSERMDEYRQNNSWSSVADKTVEVYEEVLE